MRTESGWSKMNGCDNALLPYIRKARERANADGIGTNPTANLQHSLAIPPRKICKARDMWLDKVLASFYFFEILQRSHQFRRMTNIAGTPFPEIDDRLNLYLLIDPLKLHPGLFLVSARKDLLGVCKTLEPAFVEPQDSRAWLHETARLLQSLPGKSQEVPAVVLAPRNHPESPFLRDRKPCVIPFGQEVKDRSGGIAPGRSPTVVYLRQNYGPGRPDQQLGCPIKHI